jgi:hypothetical protein
MNEFDLHLESELRLFLDPISAAPAPTRRGKRADDAPTLTVVAPEKLVAVPLEAY